MFSPEMSLRVLVFPLWLLGFRFLWKIEIMKRRFSVTSQNIKKPRDLLFELRLSEGKQSDDVEIFNFKV